MIKRSELAHQLISVTKPVMWPLAFSTLCRIIDQTLGIVLISLGAWGLATIGMEYTHPTPDTGFVSHTAGVTFGWMIGIAFIKALMRYLEQFLGHFCAFRSLELLRTDFFNKIWPQAPAIQHTTKSGDLLARATKDNDRIEVFYAHTGAPAVAAVVVPLGTLIWLGVHISWTAALIILPFVALAGYVVPFAFSGPAHRAARHMLRVRGDLTQHLTDTTQGMREVLGFGYGDRRLAETDRISEEVGNAAFANRLTSGIRRSLCEGLRLFAVVTTVLVGADAVRRGDLSIPHLAICATVALGVFTPARGTEDFADDLERSFAAAERMSVIKYREPFVPEGGDPLPAGPIDTISFHHVSFAYPGMTDTVRDLDDADRGVEVQRVRKPALRDVSVDFPGGQHTAVVGVSGSGKSTLVHMLLRHFDPDSGDITINGATTTSINPDDLRAGITEVSQSSHLFNMSIADNLRLAKVDATDAELWEALRIAGMDKDVQENPRGLDAPVGEFGKELSGGQAQRLTIARALLTDAHVLVLDEYTSHLNPELARQVGESIRAARPTDTIIEITHQPASALDADNVIVMEEGRVVEKGDPHTLAADNTSTFAHLLQRWDDMEAAAAQHPAVSTE